MLDSVLDLKTKLEDKLHKLETLEAHIMSLFPKKIDARSAFVFEQRLKAATELYRLQLAYFQEISRLLDKLKEEQQDVDEDATMELVRNELQKLINRMMSEQKA